MFMFTGLGRIAPLMAIVAFVTIALQEQAMEIAMRIAGLHKNTAKIAR